MLPLSDFDWRPPGDVTNEKVHQDVLAITRCVHQFLKRRRKCFGEECVVIAVIESRSCQDHGVIVAPLGSVDPLVFSVVPVMGSTGKSYQPIRKLLPDLKGEIHFFGGERGVVVQAQDGLSPDVFDAEARCNWSAGLMDHFYGDIGSASNKRPLVCRRRGFVSRPDHNYL